MPKIKKWVQTPHGEGRVVDRNPLKETVTVQIGENRHEFHKDDIGPLTRQGN
jgi:cell fate regulator YaaT (PSP1 superfamily)